MKNGYAGPVRRLFALLLLAAELVLAVHQLGHRLEPAIAAHQDCVLCHFAEALTTGPEPEALSPPALIAIVTLRPLPAARRTPEARAAAFQPRGPPPTLSA